VLLLTTAAVGLPLFAGRVLGGQDIVNYLIIAQQTAANFRVGEFFPAWGGGFNAGYGSPLLVFFPPVTGAVNALPVLAGMPVITGVSMLSLLAHLLSGVVFFGWARSAGYERSALPAAVVYMVAPYRLVDLYLRSALAEHWAFIWPPLILWVAASKRIRPLSQVSLIAFLVAALLLTNIPLAVLFGIGLAAWYLVSESLRGRRHTVAAGAVLGFALAGFALVPQAFASTLLDLDACFGAGAERLRPSANTLFSAGFSVWNLNTVFSMVLLFTFVVSIVAYLLLTPVQRKGRSARATILAATICVAVTIGPAGPLWDAAPVLSNLQFPWRITAVLTLIAATLVARLEHRRAWVAVVVSVILAIPLSGWDRTVPRSIFFGEKPPPAAAGTVFPDPYTAWEAGSSGWYWRHHSLVELCLLPKNMKPFMMPELAGTPSPKLDLIRDRPAVLIEDQGAPVEVIEWGQVERRVEIDASVDGTLLWRAISFPEMRAWVDGEEVEVFTDPTTGLLAHRLLRGSHDVRWAWEQFRAMSWGRAISAVALFVTIGLGSAQFLLRGRIR
jgi:hypothetical protein